jgi:hypothetical protein
VKEKDLIEQFNQLRELYNKSAITSSEHSAMKDDLIRKIPVQASPNDRRTLGKKLIAVAALYGNNSITSSEHSALKDKLIKQTPANWPGRPGLADELADLQSAYNSNAISSSEWTAAKESVKKTL